MIEELAKNALYNVKIDGRNYTVAFLPGSVAVFGFDIGKQYFSNPNNLGPDRLKELFSSPSAMREAATLHRVGILNKKKFFESLDYLTNSGQLNSVRRNVLIDMVASCDCTPEAIKRRMRNEGFTDVLGLPGFSLEDHQEELNETVEALERFINEYESSKK